jgi:hypothetical protein
MVNIYLQDDNAAPHNEQYTSRCARHTYILCNFPHSFRLWLCGDDTLVFDEGHAHIFHHRMVVRRRAAKMRKGNALPHGAS